MGGSHRVLLVRGRSTAVLAGIRMLAQLAAPSCAHHFYLQQLRGKLWSFILVYLADIFSKINEMSPSFQGKQVLPKIKFEFQVKIGISKNLYPLP